MLIVMELQWLIVSMLPADCGRLNWCASNSMLLAGFLRILPDPTVLESPGAPVQGQPMIR